MVFYGESIINNGKLNEGITLVECALTHLSLSERELVLRMVLDRVHDNMLSEKAKVLNLEIKNILRGDFGE